jgi:hypothetical protein
MNLRTQYEIDINNYKKQLEDKIEAEQLNAITANQKNEYFQKLLDKKEKENQKILEDMEYEKQMILEEMELLNEGKDKYNDNDSSDDSNRKLKHKRKQMKIINDNEEENENNMYIEKKIYNNIGDSYMPQDFSIFANQVIAVKNMPDINLKETFVISPEQYKEILHEKTFNPKSNAFIPYISPAKPLVNDDNKVKPSKHKKFSGKYNYNKTPKPDDTTHWEPYNPGWENENNNNNNNNNNINNDRNVNNNN